MARKGFTPPKHGKVEVAYETAKRPFARIKKRGAYGKVAKSLS